MAGLLKTYFSSAQIERQGEIIMILSEDKARELLEALKDNDYLYPNISDEQEAYYEGFNCLIDEVISNDLYEIECAKDADDISKLLDKYKDNVRENYYMNESSYQYDLGSQEALSEIQSKLNGYYD